MHRSFTLSLAALPLAMLASTTPPAHAVSAFTGLIQGAGQIYPALPGDGTPTLGSAYYFQGLVTPGTPVTIRATGYDLIGSLALGMGTVNLTAPIPADGVFVRLGAVVVAAVADSTGPGVAAGVFGFFPAPVQVGGPVGYYTLIGVGAGGE